MRITLSYFIEPGPGNIGWKDRYRYASHGLRFELKSPNETKDEFLKRINSQARHEEEGRPETSSPSEHWLLGQQRDVGSIHSDYWSGTAADLASSKFDSCPTYGRLVAGKSASGRWNRTARYALIVSIETPTLEVDIYTPVANKIAIPIKISIDTGF